MIPGLTIGSRSSHAWKVTDSELVPALFGVVVAGVALSGST